MFICTPEIFLASSQCTTSTDQLRVWIWGRQWCESASWSGHLLLSRSTPCAVWSLSLGLQPSPEDKLELRTDLTGVVLRATSETEPPFSQTEPAGRILPRGQVWREGEARQVTVSQFYGDVWKGLQEATNFSFSMVRLSALTLLYHTPYVLTGWVSGL